MILFTNDNAKTLAYARTLKDDIAIVALNRSERLQTVEVALSVAIKKGMPTVFANALNQKQVAVSQSKLRIQLAPLSAAVLLPVKG
jgi:hypothetical protein